MLTNKDMELLSTLLNKEMQSIHDLSIRFSLSERSIRYYIENINIELQEHGIEMHKGMCSLKDPAYVQELLTRHEPQLYTSDMKKRIIFYQLVFYGFVNLTTFSKQLDISRSSVKTYMEAIRQQLLEYHMEVVPEHKKGLLLHGSEEHIRMLQLQTLLEYEYAPNTQQQILTPIIDAYRQGLHEPQIHEFLKQLQDTLAFVLSDHSYSLMFYSCLIVLQRTRSHHVLFTCEDEYFLINCPEYKAIQQHSNILQSLNHYEILHLTSRLIGSHYTKNASLKGNEWFEHDLLISKIINLYSKYYGMNLNNDRTLYESLLTHLRPTMYRLLNNIPVSDMDTIMIQQQFPKEYEVMKKVLQELNFFTGEHQDQDETALLTLHFKAAINRCEQRNNTRNNILIVCSHGYGTSQLLEQQLRDTYEVNVVDCIPYHVLKQYDKLNEIDFIITTIDSLSACEDALILHVHPLLTKEDIVLLDKALQSKREHKTSMALLLDTIKKSCTIHDLTELKQDLQIIMKDSLLHDEGKDQTLLDILPLQNILLNYHADNWQDALQCTGNLLVDNACVDTRYKEQMLYSFENYGSYMIIDDGIAIPHAKNEGTVKKTGMTLLTLDTPVTFLNGEKLSIFFSFCSKDNIEHLDALVALANLIRETDFKKHIKQFQHPQEVLDYIALHMKEQG